MTGSVTKAMPIQFIDSKSRIKKQRGCKTALSGYYACLSRNLLLMALGWTHTHTHIHQRLRTKRFQETRCAPVLKIISSVRPGAFEGIHILLYSSNYQGDF